MKLFAPPFDKTMLDPGYIKGYLPGVRENGGQYTHAVLWLINALTDKDDGDRAMDIFDLVNPILHTNSQSGVGKYCVEPYVLAADVYSIPPHAGRGGWTWYTGSAAWAYRVAIECILGFSQQGHRLCFQPCVPSGWENFQFSIRCGKSTWTMTVDISGKSNDDQPTVTEKSRGRLLLAPVDIFDDGRDHRILITTEGNEVGSRKRVAELT